MQDISQSEGRTVLFVSHNMAAVKSLCTRGVLLEHGTIKMVGDVETVINKYLTNLSEIITHKSWLLNEAPGDNSAKITSIKVKTDSNTFFIEKDIFIEIEYVNFLDNHSINANVSIYNEKEVHVLASPNLDRKPQKKGKYRSVCKIPNNFLNSGKYYFTILLVGNNFKIITQLDKIVSVNIEEFGDRKGSYFGYWGGVVRPYLDWENNVIEKGTHLKEE
jgi:lipopolysaccharide transport system ATP-binding protein